MNAVHSGPAPLYRPQLGSGEQQVTNGPSLSSSSLNERDDPRGLVNQGYSDTLTSPLSPSGGSDFSFAKYQNDTYPQRGNIPMGFASKALSNESNMTLSASHSSLMSDRSSEGNSAGVKDVVVIEHYSVLKNYLTRHLAADGIIGIFQLGN